MKKVSMVNFRENVESVLRSIAKGEQFLLSYRGKPAAILQPVNGKTEIDESDPFLTVGRRAIVSPKGAMRHQEIDKLIYGR